MHALCGYVVLQYMYHQSANNGVVAPNDDKDTIKNFESLAGLALKVFEKLLDKLDGNAKTSRGIVQ